MKIKLALISVSDKTGLPELVKTLNKFGVSILSTGGTAKAIKEMNVPVKEVSEYTGFPEMLDGRVKTLHPKIHGGLLALRDNKEHMKTIAQHNFGLIDMVVVNLYPFEKTIAKSGTTLDQAIENIDIGGPSMLRSAAKNYRSVCVVTDPSDYGRVIEEMERSDGNVPSKLMTELGIKVFETTAKYDAAIYSYLSSKSATCGEFPNILSLTYKKLQNLRYGENPHQKAAFFKDPNGNEPSISNARQLHGKELSFNNIMDLNAALEIVKDFREPAAAIIKHTNPCGAATAKSLKDAYVDALDCDRLSAYGSIVGFNGMVDDNLAATILSEADFVECIIAKGFSPKALESLKAKKNLRLLEVQNLGDMPSDIEYDYKKVVGGLLIQDRNTAKASKSDLKIVTSKHPTKEEMTSLLFGAAIVKHVKSNAIILSHGTKTVGIGAGQMSRVDSVKIACEKAGAAAKGSTLASDAFFPKEDGVEHAARAGITAIIQPGGSIRDQEVIKAADRLGIAMVVTGIRHFKH